MVISYYENALKLLQITTKWEQNHFPVTEKSISQGLSHKDPPRCRSHRTVLDPSDRKRPWRRASQPTPVFLPRECYGQRRLVYYSPWGLKELDMIEVTEHT